MLQYADDLLIAARQARDGEQHPGGFVGSMVGGIARWNIGWKTLHMLQQGSRIGFYVPFTHGEGLIAKRGAGLWGAGIKFAGDMGGAKTAFLSGGLPGLATGSSWRAAEAAVGRSAARSAVAKYIIGRAAGLAMPFLNIVLVASFLGKVPGLYKGFSAQISKYRYMELGGYFPETQGSLTSRQRSLQAITSSHLQARSAIGNEAMLMHRGS